MLGLPVVLHAEAPTPQRPSFSSDPQTTAPGTLELEAGVLAGAQRSWDTPLVGKWGIDRHTELFLGWSPVIRSEIGPNTESGIGDLLAGTRIRVAEETPQRPSLALQLTTKLPAADVDPGLGSGEIDFYAAGMFMRSMSQSSLVGFFQVGFLGEPGGELDYEYALAFAVSRNLATQLSGFVEATAIFNPDQDMDALSAMAGLGYAADAATVFDAAAHIGLSEDADDWFVTFGLTHNFGNPFRRRVAP